MRRLLLVLPLLLLGCETPPPKLVGTGMEMFAPVKIRLHPLSRIVFPTTAPATAPAAATGPILEARIEFADQFGDVGKGIGTVNLQLFDASPLARTSLGTWTVSLNDPISHRDHWDRTSRTYLFRFPISAAIPKERDRLTLSATVTLPNNATLKDEMALPLK